MSKKQKLEIRSSKLEIRNPKSETNSLILQPEYFNIFYHNEIPVATKPNGLKAETEKKIFRMFLRKAITFTQTA